MTRVYTFADEAGNFDFSRNPGASNYFILTTVSMTDCSIGNMLTELRRQLHWDGIDVPLGFHASGDPWSVRTPVLDTIAASELRIDATILEKAKAQPQVRSSDSRFYQYAWYYHFKYVAPRIVSDSDDLHVVAASIGTKRRKGIFHAAVGSVVRQVSPTLAHRTAFWGADGDPCLQVADYCCWAIQRKWEAADERAYEKIKHLLRSEFAIWSSGTVSYY